MNISEVELRRAHDAALSYRNFNSTRAARQLRSSDFFVTYDRIHFSPANRCLSFLKGIGFDQPAESGREETRRISAMDKAGMIRVLLGNSLFQQLIDDLTEDCLSLIGNKGLDHRQGSDASKGKEIWVPGPTPQEIQVAFVHYDNEGTPPHFKLDTLGFDCIEWSETELPPPPETATDLYEGVEKQATRTVRERNPIARKLCIIHYLAQNNGRLKCIACELDFAETYGPHGEGFIHVHHLDTPWPKQMAHVRSTHSLIWCQSARTAML
ncbi:MAG: hypothetical protein ACI92Z_001193 [Paracoccaceae bacterium]